MKEDLEENIAVKSGRHGAQSHAEESELLLELTSAGDLINIFQFTI